MEFRFVPKGEMDDRPHFSLFLIFCSSSYRQQYSREYMKQPPTPSTKNVGNEAIDQGEGRSQPSESSDQEHSTSSSQVSQEIGLFDVLCGRHKDAFNNVGNRRFRVTVSLWITRYVNAPTRQDKSLIIHSISALVRETGGRFLKNRNGALVELSDKEIREKIGHALRDMGAARDMAASKDDVSLDTGIVVPGAARREGSVRTRSGNERKTTLGAMARKSYQTSSSGHNEHYHAQEWNAPLCPESGIEKHRRLRSRLTSSDFDIDQVFTLNKPADAVATSGNADEGESSKATSAVGMLDDTQEDDDGQMDGCWEDNVAPTDVDDLVNSFRIKSVHRGRLESAQQEDDSSLDWDNIVAPNGANDE
jgi:hypothetical protein